MQCNKESIYLKTINIEKNKIIYNFEVTDGLKNFFNHNHLFISYDEKIDLSKIPLSILTIPFVSSIIPLMWLTDSIMWVDEIDKTFYRSLARVKAAYQDIYYHYPLRGCLIPSYIKENYFTEEKESLVLFSGGLDAHTTYLRHSKENPLLFNIQGWYQENDYEDNKVADDEFSLIDNFSKTCDVDFLYAKSNFATLINTPAFHKNIEKKIKDTWWHGFQHSMAFISIAMPLCYYLKVKTIYISSSFTVGDIDRCASYPTVDSEFEFGTNGRVIHDAFELSRQEKVKFIVEYQKSIKKSYPIKVCSFKEGNCTICEKCVRTMLEIIAEGGDVRQFGFKIDEDILSHFKKIFEDYIVYFNVEVENRIYWIYIKERMKRNYEIIEEKSLVDWFLEEDLVTKRKRKLIEYRTKNFFPLLKKRIKGMIKK